MKTRRNMRIFCVSVIWCLDIWVHFNSQKKREKQEFGRQRFPLNKALTGLAHHPVAPYSQIRLKEGNIGRWKIKNNWNILPHIFGQKYVTQKACFIYSSIVVLLSVSQWFQLQFRIFFSSGSWEKTFYVPPHLKPQFRLRSAPTHGEPGFKLLLFRHMRSCEQ